MNLAVSRVRPAYVLRIPFAVATGLLGEIAHTEPGIEVQTRRAGHLHGHSADAAVELGAVSAVGKVDGLTTLNWRWALQQCENIGWHFGQHLGYGLGHGDEANNGEKSDY